jgi:hypothetical protein
VAELITISGHLRDDAHVYQTKQVGRASEEAVP